MAKVINTNYVPDLDHYQSSMQLYNALDCCITTEVWQKRLKDFGRYSWMTYLQEKDIQAPALEMQLRGIDIDEATAQEEVSTLSKEISLLEDYFSELMQAALGEHVNWRSPAQIKNTLNHMGFKCSGTDRETLEGLRIHFYAEPVVNTILALRDRDKLRSNIDNAKRKRTGRWHAQFKVAGTETGRLSSSKDPFGEGWNLQNINDRTRQIFTVPEGWKLAYIDLEQAEARAVAYLANDENYIAACESGDVHTYVSKMVWPELDWRGDLAKDKAVANAPFYRFFTYRDMSKRGQHGTNYFGKPSTMARHLKVDTSVMEDFQARYLKQFAGIEQWWYQIMHDLMTEGWLMTPFGRYRRFFGRPNDDSTIRKAIAFKPQSLVSDIINTGIWRVWKHSHVRILAQVHDAALIAYPESEERDILPYVQQLLEVPVQVNGREMRIPTEVAVGWNWGHYDESNPSGIREWSGEDDRERPAKRNILDARL